jgi:hypothetical protein
MEYAAVVAPVDCVVHRRLQQLLLIIKCNGAHWRALRVSWSTNVSTDRPRKRARYFSKDRRRPRSHIRRNLLGCKLSESATEQLL